MPHSTCSSSPPSACRPALSFPTSLPALRSLANRLEELKETHFHHLLGLFMAAYIYKQTFAIPGSVFMVRYSPILSCCTPCSHYTCVHLFHPRTS